ncbi:MAG: hypothetical protein M1818_005808 [Claussenomyces sp. TS43310]|nr:MAG: hypothetical protein M1818_005808 [Claussenomyces sp. TS43310]
MSSKVHSDPEQLVDNRLGSSQILSSSPSPEQPQSVTANDPLAQDAVGSVVAVAHNGSHEQATLTSEVVDEQQEPDSKLRAAGAVGVTLSTTPPRSISSSASPLQQNTSPKSSITLPHTEEASAATSPQLSNGPTMIFSDFQKNQALAHRRRIMATTGALTEYEADLTSKDRLKQKDAIKRILAGRVRDDWTWEWPRRDKEPSAPELDETPEADGQWIERDEWESNISESDDGAVTTASSSSSQDAQKDRKRSEQSNMAEKRRIRRKRRLTEEMKVNDGLDCFVQRRNAWTCARSVRRPPRSVSSTSQPRATSMPTTSNENGKEGEDEEDYTPEFEDQIPLAPPILPPNTPLRAGITPKAYSTIYDKVIMQSQTPFCPINLSTIVQSCVEGWKRDGEWPPKSAAEIEAGIAKCVPSLDARGGSAGLPDEGKSTLRRSLKKVLQGVVQTGKRKSL